MLTVAEAAARVGRNAETVRRWVRQGRLVASRDGPRLLIDEEELAAAAGPPTLPLPAAWRRTPLGDQPDWVAYLGRSRRGVR